MSLIGCMALGKSLSLNIRSYKMGSKEDGRSHMTAAKASLYQKPALPFPHASRKGDLAEQDARMVSLSPSPSQPNSSFDLIFVYYNGKKDSERGRRREWEDISAWQKKQSDYSLTQEKWD